MRKLLVLATFAVVASGFAVFAAVGLPRAGDAQGDCRGYLSDTADRLSVARTILYPVERSGGTDQSPQQDAQVLFGLGQEQLNAGGPAEADEFNGDLAEALAAGAEALGGGGGGAAPETQIAFAKSIIYNADVRLDLVAQFC